MRTINMILLITLLLSLNDAWARIKIPQLTEEAASQLDEGIVYLSIKKGARKITPQNGYYPVGFPPDPELLFLGDLHNSKVISAASNTPDINQFINATIQSALTKSKWLNIVDVVISDIKITPKRLARIANRLMKVRRPTADVAILVNNAHYFGLDGYRLWNITQVEIVGVPPSVKRDEYKVVAGKSFKRLHKEIFVAMYDIRNHVKAFEPFLRKSIDNTYPVTTNPLRSRIAKSARKAELAHLDNSFNVIKEPSIREIFQAWDDNDAKLYKQAVKQLAVEMRDMIKNYLIDQPPYKIEKNDANLAVIALYEFYKKKPDPNDINEREAKKLAKMDKYERQSYILSKNYLLTGVIHLLEETQDRVVVKDPISNFYYSLSRENLKLILGNNIE